ncbi:MAG TPA: SpoIID/LytB domain-containing protein [Bacteroidia bacterium]|jgi:stage II sporulation protein D|nr:SpoIID/LytB domain-containing protein [Bacteroidia bacterium]
MKRLSLFLFFVSLTSIAFSFNLSVHIYSNEKVTTATIAPIAGGYTIEADGRLIDSCNTTNIYQLISDGDSVILKTVDHIVGKYLRLRFHGYTKRNQLYIKPSSNKTTHHFDDDIVISSDEDGLKLINMVDLEHYVSGVIYSEAGLRKPGEYYKVQAIICRTYVLNNLARHINDGFEVCDNVHCQVYQGATANPDILKAVDATRGIVLVDDNNQLINAAFHANCGGYTLNSEDVWSSALYYLRAKQDTFCIHQPAALWEKKITKEAWNNYLTKKEKGMKKDNLHPLSYWDSIPTEKRVFLYDNGYTIPLKDIRTDWSLHSTLFTIEEDKEFIILHGRGYGHRVGLCQEGAIHMSQLGYTAQQILHFYYYDVQLVDYSILPFSGFN